SVLSALTAAWFICIVLWVSGDQAHRRREKWPQNREERMQFEQVNDLLLPGYLAFESGHKELGEGKHLVAALTRMPGCRAKMVHWWFSWLGGTDQYKLWHPTDHVFSDWENRVDGKYVGGSHLVHEYLAGSDG